jgi:hypothetical protein
MLDKLGCDCWCNQQTEMLLFFKWTCEQNVT